MQKKELKNELSKLLFCPFCGGEAVLVGDKYRWVVCRECKGSSHDFKTVEEAINAWNRRKPVDDVVEALEGAARLEITVHGGRCNGKTLTLGYAKGIESAIEIIKERL